MRIKIFERLKQSFSNFVCGIHNLIKWLPVIWHDRDWDYCYLYNILYFKLKNMEQLHEEYSDLFVNSKKKIRQLKIAKNLAKRLFEENYISNVIMGREERYDLALKKFLRNDKNSTDLKWFERCYEHADYMEEQDREYLFNLIKKHICDWWI